MNFSFDEGMEYSTNIKVVGVGGAGGNAVNRMIQSDMKGVEFIAMNTDSQILQYNKATFKLQLGGKITKGSGAGGIPERGQRAAEESRDDIVTALKGTDMAFITAGMGGGTGTGASPVIASIAKELGILTVAIVTKPFTWEGKRKMETSEIGIANLREHVDAIVVIPNSRLKLISEKPITLVNAFELADNILKQGVQSVSDLINHPGFINLDFADISSIMKDAGYAHMGVGYATGSNKAEEAALKAISSPLLETTINGAKGVIINFTLAPTVDLNDIEKAASMMTDAVHPDANIIWGTAYNEAMTDDEIQITVIATGFDSVYNSGENSKDFFPNITSYDSKKSASSSSSDADWFNDEIFDLLKKNYPDNNY